MQAGQHLEDGMVRKGLQASQQSAEAGQKLIFLKRSYCRWHKKWGLHLQWLWGPFCVLIDPVSQLAWCCSGSGLSRITVTYSFLLHRSLSLLTVSPDETDILTTKQAFWKFYTFAIHCPALQNIFFVETVGFSKKLFATFYSVSSALCLSEIHVLSVLCLEPNYHLYYICQKVL